MANILNPTSDLLFKVNSQVKIAEDIKKQEKLGNNHLKKRGGEEIFSIDESCTFSHAGMHVCGKSKKIQDKLESMSLAILQEDWINLLTLHHELMEFNPTKECLNIFGKEQMKIFMERDPGINEIPVVRRKLVSIGISEEAIQLGYEEGNRILEQEKLQEKKRFKSSKK